MARVYTSPRWFLAQAGSQGWFWPRLALVSGPGWFARLALASAGFGTGHFLAQAGSQGWLWPRLDLAQAGFWPRLVRKAGFGSGHFLAQAGSQGWLWPT
jgi:hypothetical protein